MSRIILNQFAPSRPQKLVIQALKSGSKYLYILMHRQIGKTVFVYKMVEDCLIDVTKPEPAVFVGATTIKQVRKLYGRRFDRYFHKMKGWKYDVETDGYIFERDFAIPNDKAIIDFYGSDGDRKADRGGTYNFGALDEYGGAKAGYALGVMAPMLDVKSGALICTGTALGTNHYYDEFKYAERRMIGGDKDFFALSWDAEDSIRVGMRSREWLEKKEALYPPNQHHVFRAEYLNDWHAYSAGDVYSKQMGEAQVSQRIGHFPFVTGYPVDTFWDLGVNGTCVWFRQEIGGYRRYFRFRQGIRGVHLESFIREHLIPCYEREGMNFRYHFFPHDVVFGSDMSEENRYQLLKRIIKVGKVIICVALKDIQGYTDNAKRHFDGVQFDATNCREGIKSLNSYRWDTQGKKIDKKKEEAKLASHGGDAFTLSMNARSLGKGTHFSERKKDSELTDMREDRYIPHPVLDVFCPTKVKRKKKVFYDV